MANNSLRSFASGMILATSIITAVYFFQPANKDDKIGETYRITEEEVQKYLKNKNYISIPKKKYDELINQQAKKIEETNTNTQNSQETNQPADSVPNNPIVQPESGATTTTSIKAVQEKPPKNTATNNQNVKQEPATNSTTNNQVVQTTPEKKPIYYNLRIQRGMSGLQIGKKLQSAGIVRNGVEFSKFLASKNWQSLIQVGTYMLNSDMSYEQIGTIITTKK